MIRADDVHSSWTPLVMASFQNDIGMRSSSTISGIDWIFSHIQTRIGIYRIDSIELHLSAIVEHWSIHLNSSHFIRSMPIRSHMPLVLLAAIRTQINPDSRSRSSNWLWNGPMSTVNIEYKSHNTINIGNRLTPFPTKLWKTIAANVSDKFMCRLHRSHLLVLTRRTIVRLLSAIEYRVHGRMWVKKLIPFLPLVKFHSRRLNLFEFEGI